MKTKQQENRRVAVVIGRFQPFHLGHEQLVKTAAAENDLTIIVVGSAGRAPDIKNPWSEHDRIAMLSSIFHGDSSPDDKEGEGGMIRIIAARDHLYDDNAWLKEVKIKLGLHLRESDQVTLYGHDKDHSTFYLSLFPEWNFKDPGEFSGAVDATSVRAHLFENKGVPDNLPEGVQKYLRENWLKGDEFKRLRRDYDYIKKIEAKEKSEKHPPIYVTVDAVVVFPGKVLTVKRKGLPGEGLRALPGLFLGHDETLLEGAMRAAEEKAGMVLKAEWMTKTRCFDHPRRSLAGRRISHAFRFDVPRTVRLNFREKGKFKGEWIDVADVETYAGEFFEDHGAIIEEMLK